MVVVDYMNRNVSGYTFVCKPPLWPTQITSGELPFHCSPACLDENWPSQPEKITFDIMVYVTFIFCWTCIIVTFITWAKVAEL